MAVMACKSIAFFNTSMFTLSAVELCAANEAASTAGEFEMFMT
jgi:hypothetical protein